MNFLSSRDLAADSRASHGVASRRAPRPGADGMRPTWLPARAWAPARVRLLLLALLFMLPVLSGPLHAYETSHVWCVLQGTGGATEGLRINLTAGQAVPAHLPAGSYSVDFGGHTEAISWNGTASVAAGLGFRMFLGAEATDVWWSGSASAEARGWPGGGDNYNYASVNSTDGSRVASVYATGVIESGSEACGWIREDSWAGALVGFYANSAVVSGVLDLRGLSQYASHYSCGIYFDNLAAASARIVAFFTLPYATDTIIITDSPPGEGTNPQPTLPDQTTPAAPGSCTGLPTYLFHSAGSGGSFTLPVSGSALRFGGLDTTRFTGIGGFPAGPTWVDVGPQSYGPFTAGQSFSFADQPGGTVAGFTLRADTGQIPALTGFQLAFEPNPGAFQVEIVGPPDVRIDAERLSAGQPPTQTSPLAVARGESVRFTAHVPGSCANTYQWRRDGVALPGETGPTLNLAGVGSEHYGAYSVVVQNELGTAESPGLVLKPLLYTLTVNAAGGTVTKSPDQAGYEPGTVVTLQAAPAAGFTFAGWDGELHSTANPVQITMDQNRTVTAWFGNPFGGAPRTIPGRIEAEDFDEGGEDVAYHDADEANQGGSTYRTGGVDVIDAGTRKEIGWSDTGEWLNYTVNAPAAGLYRAVFRVSSGMSGGMARLRFSGGQTPADVAAPGTGSWGTFVEVASEPFSLPAGLQVMRFEYAQAGFDLDWIEIQSVVTGPFGGTPRTIPGRIEAEDFDDGIEGVAYHDTSAENQGGSAHRTGSVDVGARDGGLAVVWSDTGEWLNYTVNVTAPGLYRAVLRVSAGGSGGTGRFRFGAGAPLDPIAVSPTGSWETFAEVASAPFTLTAGEQVMRFEYAQSGFDLDWIELQRVNNPPVADAGGPYTIDQGNPLVLGGSGTDPDTAAGDSIVSYEWDLNDDGTFGDATGATPTLSASVLQILGLGFGAHPIHLRVTDSHGASATASTTLLIRGTQTIAFDSTGMRVLGSAPFPMWAYADSGLPVTLTSLTPSVATVDGDIVTLLGLGTATIRASQAGNADWQPAPDVELTFEVWKPSSLWAWGNGSQGRLGAGDSVLSTVPQAVGAPPEWDGHTVASVATGEAHTLALLDDGSVWAWGFNDYGGLGNGQTSDSYAAVAVSAPTAWNGHKVVSVAAGGVHSLALLDDGSAWAWGRNDQGQLGNGQTSDSSVPVPVLTPTAWNGHKLVRIAAGRYNHSLAVLDDGSVWAWGSGYYGQLGNGSTVDSSVPVAVAAPVAWNGRKVVSVTAGNVHSLAVLDDGSIWAWGHGAFGQLGNGQTSNSSVPVRLSAPVAWTGHTVVNVTAGGLHNLAVLDDGSAWAWGANWNGQLGNGQTANSSVPVPVLAPAAWTGRRIVSVAAETQHSLAVLDDGSVWAWGHGAFGQLGNGQTANSSVPAPVSAPAAWSGQKAVSVGAGDGFSVALLSTLNSAPTLVNPLANQSATYGAPFTFSVPANTFADAGAGQTLSYSASGLTAWLAFDADSRTFSGTPTAPGSFTLTVTATDDGTPALSASTTFDLVVGKAPLAATGDTLYRFYGEENPPLTGTLEGVVNGDNITASYSTTATPTGAAGVYTIYVTLNDPDSRLGNYEVTLVTGALRVERAPQTITFGVIPPHVFGDAPFTVPVSASSGLPVTLTSSAASVATVSGTTLTITGAGATLLTAYQPGDGNFQAAAFVQVSYSVGKATPAITWATPAPITSSTPLSGAQLNATANVAGSFAYTPAAGTTLPRGTHVLSAEFTPGDAANYTSASATVSLEVLNSAPVATAQSVTTAEDAAVAITLAGTDADADALSYSVVSSPAHGTLSGAAPNLTYTPTADYNGTDSFTFKVNDGTVDSALATVSIEVLPVNDPPVAFDRVVTTLEDTPIDVRLDGNDTEASGYRTLFSLASGRGEYPTAPLAQGVDGLLYGTASGDENGQGVVFRIAPDGSGYAVLHRFTPWAFPFAGLLVGSDGFLYGTTRQGGTGPGTVYRLRPDGADFEIVHAFEGGVNAGFAPEAGVIEGADGFLYGTTYQGNSGAAGTVFRLAKDGSDFGVLYTFGLTTGDGRNPDAPVVQGADGALYGTTRWGGSQNYGSIFRLDPNAPMETRVRLLHSFQGGVADGREPLSGGLVLGGDGLLYGTTWLGGADNNGVLFRIGIDGTGYAILRQMTGVDGIRPKGGLLWGSDGALYGAAEQGGRSGGGTVFRLMPDGSDFRVLWNLSASGSGARYPIGKMLEGDDGLLYGAGNRGGDNNVGALFALAKAPQGLTFTVLQSPAHGTLSGTPPALTYTPAPDFSGSDYFTFKVNDGAVDSATATVTIIVTPVNDLPVANSQSITTAEDTAVAVALDGSDADANALSYSVVSGPAHGTLSGTAPNLSYTPTANYHGPDSFTFKVNDGSVDSVPATVAITVTSVNDAPVAVDDAYTTDEDTVLIVPSPGVLANDTDVDEGPLVRFRFHGHMTSTDADFTSGDALEGFYAIDPATAGVPDLDATTTLQFDSRNVAWEIRFPARGYGFSGDWVELNVGNDTAYGDRYIATFINGSSVGVALPSGRQLSFAQFDPRDPVAQGADFLHDDSIQSTTLDLASAQITAGRFRFEDNAHAWFTLDALQGPQTVTAVNGAPASVNSPITLPSGALLRLNCNGSFRYDPNGQFNHLAAGQTATDSFTYQFSDPDGGSATATATVTITGVNDAPVANSQSVTTAEDTPVAITLTGADAEGRALTYWVLSGADHGDFTIEPPNLVYTPHPNFNGTDVITFRVSDGPTDSTPASVTITVTAVNDLPTAQGQSLTTYDNQTLAITLAGADVETANLTYRITSGSTAGTLGGTPPNVGYTPPFPYAGNDSFTFEVEDADGATASATVAITVLASDRPPVAVAGSDRSVVAGTDCQATVTVDGSASSDPDGDALNFAWELRQNGQVVGTANGQPAASWSLIHGTYEAVLTVSTDKNGTTVSRSDSLVIAVLPSAPALAALSPASAYAGGPDFTLTVTGGCFLPGAVVHWNGQPRTTTAVGSSELVAAIPASDLLTGVDIAVASVTVVNGDGQVSPPLAFSLVPPTVGTADAAVALPGNTASASTAPTTPGEPGVSVTVNNGGTEPVSVLAATYDTKPVGETAFRVDNGAFVDVQVSGASPNVAATVWFYYPSTVTGRAENRVKLRYFNGTDWIPVRGSEGAAPIKDTTDDLDGTISGGRFAVIFDATSTPTIIELSGTVFGLFESAPQIQAVTGPVAAAELGDAVNVGVDFAVVGDPAAAQVQFLWDDGTETTVGAQAPGHAEATHLFAGPGVYGVTVRVSDAEGDVGESRFDYVVICDPNGGAVAGAGWVELPDEDRGGRWRSRNRGFFEFNARYQRGRPAPVGQACFRADDLGFQATELEWLVVGGNRAQVRGTGKLNGQGHYGFLLTASNGKRHTREADEFRIKIWDPANGTVVYDNRPGTSDDLDEADPQPIGGGSIVIQRGK